MRGRGPVERVDVAADRVVLVIVPVVVVVVVAMIASHCSFAVLTVVIHETVTVAVAVAVAGHFTENSRMDNKKSTSPSVRFGIFN